MIQNSASGSFYSSYIKNPIPGYVKLVVSAQKYCVLLKWGGGQEFMWLSTIYVP